MKPFVFIFRPGSRELSAEEQQQLRGEARAWALGRIKEGRELDPRILTPDYYFRVSARGESDQPLEGADAPPSATLFLQAKDSDEAVALAKTHPGLRYGTSIEVRAWTSPLAAASPTNEH